MKKDRYKQQEKALGFSRFRYEELRAFCRQYPEKKKRAEDYLNPHSVSFRMDSVQTNSNTDSTLTAVQKREKLLKDCQLIEECARDADDRDFFKALMINVCYKKPYELVMEYCPTFNRGEFFTARKHFFQLLDMRKG